MASEVRLRAKPGGGLRPQEVIGRDLLIAMIWRILEGQSLLFIAERRMGKTSVLNKMAAEPAPGMFAIKRTLQGITSADEFARRLVQDIDREIPDLLETPLSERLSRFGIKSLGVSPVTIEFEPASARSWKDVVEGVAAALDEVDVTVVLLWDELPHMVADIRDNHGPHAAREVLDVLRGVRESHAGVRMVFSGSLGLHHVVDGLREHGGMWVPTHDMRVLDLPPLIDDDAVFLARELLLNEEIECVDVDAVARAIAGEVDRVPYYVHHTVDQLRERQVTGRGIEVDVAAVHELVEEMLSHPLDPWQLKHYVDRVPVYYPSDADVVRVILDTIAVAGEPPGLDEVARLMGAQLEPPAPEDLHALLTLLAMDHYIDAGPAYAFKLSLVQRAWRARRPGLLP